MSTGTASEVLGMLTRHYLPDSMPPAGILASEIGSPDGSRRADAIWLPTTTTKGTTGMVGHEIKVSRADVLVELADPSKADPWMQYCHRWWLTVSDPALVEGLDIPPQWGIMAPPSGRRTRTMTIVRQAPELHPIEPAVGVQRVTAWVWRKQREKLVQLSQVLGQEQASHERTRDALARAQAAELVRDDPRAAEIHKILTALDAARASGPNHVLWRASAEDIAAAIADRELAAAAARDTFQAVESVLSALDRVLSRDQYSLRRARDAVATMRKRAEQVQDASTVPLRETEAVAQSDRVR